MFRFTDMMKIVIELWSRAGTCVGGEEPLP